MFPIERELGPKTKGRYGFKDGRVEISVRIKLIGWQTLVIEREELALAATFLEEARKFCEMPEDERERIGAK